MKARTEVLSGAGSEGFLTTPQNDLAARDRIEFDRKAVDIVQEFKLDYNVFLKKSL